MKKLHNANPGMNKDRNYFFDIAKLVTGNGFAQIVKSLLSIIISRLYQPEHFGIMQNFSSLVNIFSVTSSLRYEQTIILPKDEKRAINQAFLSLFFTLLTTLFFSLAIFIFGKKIALILNSPILEKYLWLFPINVFILGVSNIFNLWNTRFRKFSRLVISNITNEMVAEGTTVGLGMLSLASSDSMIISRILGRIVSLIFLATRTIKEQGRIILKNFELKIMFSGISLYKKFPIFNIWSTLLNSLALYLPGIIISAYFSPTIAGFYSLGQNVLRLPVSLISASISQVFLQRGMKSLHEGKITSVVEETFRQLVSYGLFPMLVLLIVGKEIFILLFGLKWATAGIFSQILSLWTLAIFISTPLLNIIIIMEKNETGLLLNIVKVFTCAGSLIIGGIIGNIYIGLYLFTIFGVFTYGGFVLWALKISGSSIKKSIGFFIKNLIFCSPFILSIIIFKYFNPLPNTLITRYELSLQYLGLISFTLFAGIVFYLFVIGRDKSAMENLRYIFHKYISKNNDI